MGWGARDFASVAEKLAHHRGKPGWGRAISRDRSAVELPRLLLPHMQVVDLHSITDASEHQGGLLHTKRWMGALQGLLAFNSGRDVVLPRRNSQSVPLACLKFRAFGGEDFVGILFRLCLVDVFHDLP